MRMSDETQRALQDAATALAQAEARAEETKRACLEDIAAGIPAAVDAHAKQIAHSQPDITRQLGPEGVKALREELAAEAASLADFVRAGVDKIEWPPGSDDWITTVEPRKVSSALFTYMHGRPINQVGEVFGRHGYDVKRNPRSAKQSLILPQMLYTDEAFKPVAAALTDLITARRVHSQAKAADDQVAVEDLWS
ncbi:TPA: hypothetical protein JFU91_002441 [Enterococcus faecium]|nr:hypothetical protein [Enterococcus faecium]